MIFSELEFYLTAVCNLDRACNGIRVGRKERKHLLFRLDVKLARLKLHAGGIVHRFAHLNGHQHILNPGIFTGQIVRVIGRDQRNAGLVRQAVQTHIDFFLCLDAVILNFQKEIILSENLTELECLPFGALIVAVHQCLRNGTGQAGRQADESLAVLAQQIQIDAGTDIKALRKTQADHVNEVAVTLHVLTQQNQVSVPLTLSVTALKARARCDINLTADDRVNAARLGSSIKINGAVHDTVVGHCDRGLSQFGDTIHQLLNPACAVEQTIFGMYVQMCEIFQIGIPSFYSESMTCMAISIIRPSR